MRKVDHSLFLDTSEFLNIARSIATGCAGKNLRLLNERFERPGLDLFLTGGQRVVRIFGLGEFLSERIPYIEGSSIEKALVFHLAIFNGPLLPLLEKIQHHPANDDGENNHHQKLWPEAARLIIAFAILAGVVGE